MAGDSTTRSVRGKEPDAPTDLPKHGWLNVAKRSFKEFNDDALTDWAAALTYYAVLALFPAFIALISIVSLVFDPQQITRTLLSMIQTLGPADAAGTLRPVVQGMAENQKAGLLLIVGLLGALWSASGYVSAFTRASNAIYEIEEGRPFWKLRPYQMFLTLVFVLLIAIVAIGLVVTGPVAEAVGSAIGLQGAAIMIWRIAKWPVMALVVAGIISLLYYSTPNVKQPKFRWLTVGGGIALVVWALASVAFGFYVANFGSFDKTYGTLGGVIVFLTWLWITNIAILYGAEFDAELEREREIVAGVPGAKEEIQLPPRDPANEKDEQKAERYKAATKSEHGADDRPDRGSDHIDVRGAAQESRRS